jgi:hypothetical protein
MLRVVIPILISVVAVLLIVGLAMRTDRLQFSWTEIMRRGREATKTAEEAVEPASEVTT